MTDAASNPPEGNEAKPGGELVTILKPLHPSYDESHHRVYVDHLNRALVDEEDAGRILNIALTGSYGIGKSSILQRVAGDHPDRTLSISLATLSGDAIKAQRAASDDSGGTPHITNLIQKEIVKQLLYRVSPSKVPRSRYSRIQQFHFWPNFLKVGIVLSALTVVAFLLGWIDPSAMQFGDHWYWQLLSGIAALSVVAVLVTWALSAIPSKIQIGGEATAGGASITLSAGSDNFFDEYLDEIIYFFEETEFDIVILEDIDRFDDPYIFETLRELNTILNGSEHLSQRPIRFIYAIKDSIFEKLGQLEAREGSPEQDSEELARSARTNRTKFFDIVVPVVPFITHKNSRDHLTDELKDRNIALPPEVINITARHITEKRLITNIVNEYIVFAQKVLNDSGVEGLKPELLLAMIVYKNLFLADYEKITHGDSDLDTLYESYRDFVDTNIERLDGEIASLRKQIRDDELRARRADLLAGRLAKRIGFLASTTNISRQGSYVHNGVSYTDDELKTPAFWEALAEVDAPLSIPFATQNYYGQPRGMQLTRAEIEDVLEIKLGDELWGTSDLRRLQDRLTKAQNDREFIRYASLGDLLAFSTFYEDDSKRTLRVIMEERFKSQLVRDLLDAGLIEQNFTLYVSQYQGTVVKPLVRTFIMRCVEKNSVDTFYDLGSDTDIEQLLTEVTETRWTDRFMYNVSIFNYLLKSDDPRLDGLLPRLARFNADAETFLAKYLSTKDAETSRLIERLAAHWSRVMVYVADEAEIDEDLRLTLIDAAIRGATPEISYETSDSLVEHVRAHYGDLKSLAGATTHAEAARLCTLLESLRIKLPSLTGLGDAVKVAVVAARLYDFCEANLASALGQPDLALDLAAQSPDVYGYIKDNIDDYARIATASSATEFTVRSKDSFAGILEDIASSSQTTLRLIIKNSAPDCNTDVISELHDNLWPALSESRRFPVSLSNIEAYIECYGVDEPLASYLNETGSISGATNDEDDTDRMKIALAILNAEDINPEAKASITKSLRLRHYVAVDNLDESVNASPELFQLLVERDVVSDKAGTFSALAERPWPVRENFILGSKKFPDFLGELELTTETFRGIAKSNIVAWGVKRALLPRLQEYAEAVDGASCGPLARLALSKRHALPVADIELLAAKRVRTDTIIDLVLTHADTISRAEFLAIMRRLPDPYVRLAKALAKPPFTDTQAHRRLLAIPKRLGLMSDFKIEKKMLKASMRSFSE
ncbi:hypothetical protein ACFWFR_02900 [Oerskovia sp. NPDC060287]|uniref:YobI family P-loop NTPase n=1 Tax=Oerskovia sp. NPDC060287 TaxID=3347095 RepID=UPI0036499E1E